MSPALQSSLRRARDYAAAQGHLQVSLEHLLLALSEDEDAALVLQACRVDLGRLRNDVAGHIGTETERTGDGTPSDPSVSGGLTQILKYATLAARQGKRPRIDGAIVLAAIVGEGRSMAAAYLKAQGLTFEAVVRALQQATGPARRRPETPDPAPPPPPAAGGEATLPSTVSHPPAVQPPAQAPAAPIPVAAEVAARPVGPPTRGAVPSAEDLLAAARARIEQRGILTRPDPASASGAARGEPATASVATSPAPPVPSPAAAEQATEATAFPQAPTAPLSAPDDIERLVAREIGAIPAGLGEPVLPRETAGDDAGQADAPRLHETPLPSAFAEPIQGVPRGATARPEVERPQPLPHVAAPSWAPPPLPTMPRPPTGQPPRMPPAQPAATPVLRPVSPVAPPSVPARPAAGQPPPQPVPWAGRPEPDHASPPPAGAPSRPPLPEPAAGPAPSRHVGLPQLGPSPAQALMPAPGAAHVPGSLPSSASAATTPAPVLDPSHVSHTIPARLTAGAARTVEVKVARPPLPMRNPHQPGQRGDGVVVRAVGVRLRAIRNGCIIDAPSPETLWDKPASAGRLAAEAGVWRFVLTPQRSGSMELTLQVTACQVGADGMLAETALPERTITVRVVPNIGRIARRIGVACGLVVGAVVLAEGIEMAFRVNVLTLLKRLVM